MVPVCAVSTFRSTRSRTDKFGRITRWGKLANVIRGIDAAQEAGLRVKINAVALKGFNEDELIPITEWCASPAKWT